MPRLPLGRACHAQRKNFDLNLEKAGYREIRRAFYRALADAGLGREAAIVAVAAATASPIAATDANIALLARIITPL